MLQKNKLFSIKTSAGSRDYIFDIKVSVDGIKYLVIKEVREGFKTKQIIIFEEHLQTFYKNFRKSIKFMRNKKTKTYNIEYLRHDYPKAYTIWSRDEDDRLIKLYIHNKTIKEIAFIYQRKPSAVLSRLKKLKKLGLL